MQIQTKREKEKERVQKRDEKVHLYSMKCKVLKYKRDKGEI